ncbi:MAG: ATP-binding protein [Armatimonadota bacterium]|nr:ATP-binding protein [Armatimonadota bacterium]
MEIKEAALAVTAMAAVALGIAVYQRTPDRVWNRLFAVHAVGGGIWTFLNFLLETADTPGEAELWLRLAHPVVAMVICTVVDFAWVFPDRMEYADPGRRTVLYAIGSFFGAAVLAPNFVRGIEIRPEMIAVDYGWPFAAFGLFTVFTLGYADVVLLTKAIRLEGVQRVQVIWVLLGLAGSHFVASLVIIIIPLIWDTTAYSGWGASGYIITLAGMGYAIAKHRLMQPDMALRRLASAMVSAGVVLSLGIGGLQTLQPVLVSNRVPMDLAYVVMGLFMGMVIVVIHDRVAAGMRRVLSVSTDPASVQAEASSHILRTLDAAHLVDYLVQALADALEPTNVVAYTREDGGGRLAPRASAKADRRIEEAKPRAPLDVGNHLVRVVAERDSPLTRDHVYRFEPLEEAKRLALAMGELDAEIVAPMMWEDELIGLVTIGPAMSGDMYTEDDIRFVSEMVLQASLGLRNAELYAQTEELKDFNERILRQMDNAVVVSDPDEQIVVFNQAAQRLFDIPGAKAIGASIDVLPEGIANCMRASLGSGRILSSQHFEIEQKDRTLPLACSTSPLAGDGEGPQGAVAVISDLTLIKELDQERQAAERLALIQVISAGMAHEIRNPLVAIRTFAELAPKRLDDPDFRSNFLSVAQEEIKRIDKLVGDLLTLSKPADAVVEPVDLDQISRQVVRSMAGVAEAKAVTVELQVAELESVPRGDPSRLHQALLNLVRNAIDAEPNNGQVTIAIEGATDAKGRRAAVIRVHNPNSYIPPDDIEEIFRPFMSKKPSGTGLGLAICQTIIEEHGGEITVESSREGGTEFAVVLPLARSRTPMMTAGDR